jgi:hypothetical protein
MLNLRSGSRFMRLKLILFFPLLFCELFAQTVPTADVSKSDACNIYKERVLLHVNTEFLLTGETLLFKAYCLDAQNHHLSTLSKILYVELIAEDGTATFQKKIALEKGLGYGDFFLSSDIVSGNYTLVAYTRWMRNFSEDLFFRTELTIVNPFNKGYSYTSTNNSSPIIKFFPEGGKLSVGAINKVAYRLTHPAKYLPDSAKIFDDEGQTVKEFRLSPSGIGDFEFSPKSISSYKTAFTDTLGNVHFAPFPPSVEAASLQIKAIENEVQIAVDSKQYSSSNLRIVLLHEDAIVDDEFFTSGYRFIKTFKTSTLPKGVILIQLFDNDLKIAERFFFNKPTEENKLRISLKDRTIRTREKVSVAIENNDLISSCNISVSVHLLEKSLVQRRSINDHFYFKTLDNASLQNIPASSTLSPSLLDLYMLTASDSDLRPDEVNCPATIFFLPDLRGEQISGLIVKKNTTTPITNQNLLLSIPYPNRQFFSTETNTQGRFYFNLEKTAPANSLIFHLKDNDTSEFDLEIDKVFLEDRENFKPTHLSIDTAMRSLIERRSVFNQIQNAYYEVNKDSVLSAPKVLNFYGIPDRVYKLEDYAMFPTMEDVFREYIPEVTLLKRKDNFELYIVNSANGVPFIERPLIILDGVAINNNSFLANFDPVNVKQIEIVRRRYYYGNISSGGIISIVTNSGFEDLKMPGFFIKRKFSGISPSKFYQTRAYSSERFSRIPDYRSQLLWNPNITLPVASVNEVEFYSGDQEGIFLVEVEGVADSGEVIYMSAQIEVRN